ncbi:protoporphyrinogen oxidase [Hymenobacter saemangeumensis]|uniref:Coproporphyrinogen III oxidase n=1 Tax=Hymenobacter saemangeumensis TaxID=1084522 RepID=A0ABP8INX8_9BACT
MKVAIIGGGIAGLTLAWYLQKSGVAYDLFEADSRPGGNFLSQHLPGYLLESGPNSLQLSAELAELLGDLGLSDQLQDTAAVSQHRYVLRGGQYRQLPGSPPALLKSSFFSWKAKGQVLGEMLRKAGPRNEQETVAQFFRRRFGPEIVDYAVNPFMAGIYAGDPEQLLIHKTFPQLVALEQEHGSLLRGLMKTSKGATRRRIVSLQGGVQVITDTLAAKLTNYHAGRAVAAVERRQDGSYQLTVNSEQLVVNSEEKTLLTANDSLFTEKYTHLALALPAYAAAPLLQPLFPEAAAALAAVRYPPMSVLYSAYDRAAVAHPLNGFGALHPKVEGAYAAGSIWTSSIYPSRVPAGQVLFTTFVGGSQYEEAARQPEEIQKAAVHAELSRLYGITAGPRWQTRYFWPRGIPQFDQHIVAAHAAADALQAHNIVAVASWRAGVGVPDCLRHARRSAEALA